MLLKLSTCIVCFLLNFYNNIKTKPLYFAADIFLTYMYLMIYTYMVPPCHTKNPINVYNPILYLMRKLPLSDIYMVSLNLELIIVKLHGKTIY